MLLIVNHIAREAKRAPNGTLPNKRGALASRHAGINETSAKRTRSVTENVQASAGLSIPNNLTLCLGHKDVQRREINLFIVMRLSFGALPFWPRFSSASSRRRDCSVERPLC